MTRPHLRDMTIEELEQYVCEVCKDPDMTMDSFMCPTCSKSDEVICVECCGCFDE